MTPEQLNAIELLLQGKSDQDTADAVGRDRVTIWQWCTRNPLFSATLEQRRAEVFGAASNRLKSLMSKALDNIEAAIEGNTNIRWSFELLKAAGVYGFVNPLGETDPAKVAFTMCLQQLAQEHIPENSYDLITPGRNPAYQQRQREILEELGRGDLA